MSDFPRPNQALGVFETLLIVAGAPVELDAHLERLQSSVRELFAQDPPANARELVLDHARPLELGRLRLTLAPTSDGPLLADVFTAAIDRDGVFPRWERAIELRSFVVPGGIGAHKWADRTGLAQMEAQVPEGCLPLVLDAGQVVLEASRSNLFAVEQGVLLTPPRDGRILPGVARARAIGAARALGIEVRERELTLERLAGGEAFLTNAVRGLQPVRSVDEAELRPPGEAAREIASSLKRDWIGERVALGG